MVADTIFALASGAGRAGVAVVRVSGSGAGEAILRLARRADLPRARYATRAFLYEAESKSDDTPIDDALVIWFPGPNSFTGEDVAEFHIHGGHAVLDALLTSLSAIEGLRPAGPGEFSRRAFENGKMDLTAAEAIADLVDAETEAQRRQAVSQMGGALAALYDGWRTRLIHAMAFAEATIDFSEEDIPDDLVRRSLQTIEDLVKEIAAHLDDGGISERIRSGFRIALTGAPNVGKSSLLNALAKRDVAIVSEIAGTTRDAIEVPMNLGGYPATLIDTAGLRESEDVIEQEGVRRARKQVEEADLRVLLLDARSPVAEGVEADLVVVNKTDLAPCPARIDGKPVIGLSVKTGQGLDTVIAAMSTRIAEMAQGRITGAPALTRARHRHALMDCQAALQRVVQAMQEAPDIELVAEDLRHAAQALGSITGRVDVEDLLDKIFSDFCIGK